MGASPAVTVALALGVGSLVSGASDRLRIPALLPLIGAGLALGRSGFGVVDTRSLGELLPPIITLGIGILVYEGALHLTGRELRKAPRAVGGLLTTGVLVTWLFAAAAAVWTLGYGWSAALLVGAMLTVTGPTVVQPLLRRIRVTPRLRTALAAEAVLVDPIGVLLVVVVLTMLKGAAIVPVSGSMLLEGARLLGFQVVTGAAVGLAVGMASLLLGRVLTVRGRTNPQQMNFLAVGSCMVAVGIGALATAEAGLVAAVVAALCLGRMKSVGLSDLHAFKQQLASLTVGTLFILLAAKFDLRDLAQTGWGEMFFAAALIVMVRPASATLALVGSHLTGRERAFVAGFAPRGIVALSVAVIAANDLAAFALAPAAPPVEGAIVDLSRLVDDARSFERVIFLAIAATVCWASIAGPLAARLLGVGGSRPSGILLVGGHRLSIETAGALRRAGVDVTLLDSRYDHLMRADAAGVPILRGDATDLRWLEDQECCEDLGLLLAWTGNQDVDAMVARWASERLGPHNAAIWADGRIPVDAAWLELGGGRLLQETIDEIEASRWTISSLSAGETNAIPFLVVESGRPRFLAPGEAPPEAGNARSPTLIGLVRATS